MVATRVVGRGEVWWSESAECGRRPVLVLTRDAVADRLTAVLTAVITTVRRDIPTEVYLDEDDGMPKPCVVNLDSVSSQPRAQLIARVTRLGPERMAQVCKALAHATGC